MSDITVDHVESTDTIGARLNPFASKLSQAPHDIWTRLRNECPVAHSDELGGFHLLSRYEDVWAATLDTETYSSAEGTTVPRHPVRMPPEDTDEPEHRMYRKIMDPLFTPKTVKSMESWVREMTVELLDSIEDLTKFDFVGDFSSQLPRHVILRIIGVPDEDLPELIDAMIALNGAYDDAERGAAAGATLYGYFAQKLAERREQPRRDDLISALLDGDFGGEPLSDLDMQHMLILTILGGTDTSSGAMGGMMLWLADHPEDYARLREDPDLMRTAIDEFLRYVSPVAYMARTTTRDVEVQGCPIPHNEKVLLGFGPANRDSEKFERADEVLLDRHPNPHVAFGGGPHRCLGANLVKLEMKVVLEEVINRFKSFEVEDYTKLRYQRGQARNLECLPLVTQRNNP